VGEEGEKGGTLIRIPKEVDRYNCNR